MLRWMRCWMMRIMGMPTCEEITELAYGYLEGRLNSDLHDKFERHLQGCVDCERFVRSYKYVANPDRLARPIPLDPDFERRTVEFLKNEMK